MKFILLPIMMIFEILLLLLCVILAVCHKPLAKKLIDWVNKHIPSIEWYKAVEHDNEH